MATPTKRSITAEDLYKFGLISDVRISPDSENIVYSTQRVDQETEKKFANLWMIDTHVSNSEPRQFTVGNQNDTQPRWSPSGNQIAFLSNRSDLDKPPALFIIPAQGGEARQLTDIEGEINSYSWSPDGNSLICCIRKTDPDELERQKDERKKKLGVVARHYDRVFYKLDDYGFLPKERWHLWRVAVPTGEATQLTDHPVFDELAPAWSPDGRWVAFLSNRTPEPDFHFLHIDLFLMPANGGELRKIETPPGEKTLLSFSPDGQWIAYYGVEGEDAPYKNQGLWVVRADGSQPPRNLTAPYDLHVSAWTINDMGKPEDMPPTWSRDGRRIYFPVLYHGSTILQSIGTDGSDLHTEIGEGGVVGSFSFDESQRYLAYFYGQMADPGQVFLLDTQSRETRQMTHLNQSLLDEVDLGEMETVWFQGPAGDQLQGWILKPPGFDPERKYPSILEIHGGPLTQYGYFFMHEFYYLAAQGYVVYFSNPRGGRGYGEALAKAIHQRWGDADYADLMAWADFIEALPYIDRQRMGVTGGSYGGYMTVWIIGHTQRFKAAVTQRCVSNLTSMWGSSDYNWTFELDLMKKPPFEDLQRAWDLSPIKYIENAKTPTLVIHSEWDHRCPIEQGEQVFVALRRLGVDSEMVRFPEEFHGLSRTGRTDRRIVRLRHIQRWFDRYLKS
jgi:dipeptidyl aminopeptidase/acylaminoacyl peptidase